MNYEESFSLLLGANVNNNPYLLWQYVVPIMKKDEKKLFMHFEKNSFVLTNYQGEDYPRTIKIAMRNYNGDFISNNK